MTHNPATHTPATHNPASSDSAITLDQVSKVFPGGSSPAVDSLTLEVPVGEVLALVGPSGCGKTTTLRMINRLIEPTAGCITVLGEDHRTLPAHELRRRIGYVIQQIGLFPHHRVRRNIGAVLELLKWPRAQIEARIEELIDLVGLDPELLDRYPGELSGGQQQRVGVARALAADPPILLMDEPYSAVDPIVREHLQDELLALQARVRKTIVIVTHDVDEALRLADRVAVMRVGGQLAQLDTPMHVLAHPADEFVAAFLGRERGLRRLSLSRVEQVMQRVTGDDPTVIEHGAAIIEHGAAIIEHGAAIIEHGAAIIEHGAAIVSPTMALREALDAILTSPTSRALVHDDTGQVIGVVDIDMIAAALRT